jgi:hypothetical protein
VTNPGVAFDFGAVYNLNKMFSFSASIVDLGFINWKDDLSSYSPKSNTLIFPISTLQDVVDQTITLDSLFGGIKNTIDDNFKKDPTPAAYKTRLPTVINLGATINLLPVLSFGILSNSKIWSGQIKESLTLSANTYIGKFFSGSISYTTANYSFDNFGIGIAFKAGPGQIYIIADKIPLSWSRIYLKKGNGGFTPLSLPDRWNTLNFQIGLNFAFGKVVDTKVDKPMLSGLIY